MHQCGQLHKDAAMLHPVKSVDCCTGTVRENREIKEIGENKVSFTGASKAYIISGCQLTSGDTYVHF